MDALDLLVRNSLLDLANFVSRTGWHGREREVVSLFAFGFLVPRCHPKGPLREPTQIGLDVAVAQITGPGRKAHVCKDLVIWPEPAGTCWDLPGGPTRKPLAILEWKARTDSMSDYDEAWLRAYSEKSPEFCGYAVSIYPRGTQTTLSVSRVKTGLLKRSWLRFPENGRAV
jgi:hypothetical protein